MELFILNRRNEQGSAFIIVLWLIAILAALVSSFSITSIAQLEVSDSVSQHGQSEVLAQTGLEAWLGQFRAAHLEEESNELVVTEVMHHYPTISPVSINEIDPAGECGSGQRVAVYNRSKQPVNITGWYIRDRLDNEFSDPVSGSPNNPTILGPSETYIFQEQNTVLASGVGAADTVALYSSNDQLMDEVGWPNTWTSWEGAGTGESMKVYPDGWNGYKLAERGADIRKESVTPAWQATDCSVDRDFGEADAAGMWVAVGSGDYEALEFTQRDENGNVVKTYDFGINSRSDINFDSHFVSVSRSDSVGYLVLTNDIKEGDLETIYPEGDSGERRSIINTAGDFPSFDQDNIYVSVNVPKPAYGDVSWSEWAYSDTIVEPGVNWNQVDPVDSWHSAGATPDTDYLVRINREISPNSIRRSDTENAIGHPGDSIPQAYTGLTADYEFNQPGLADGRFYISELFDTFVPQLGEMLSNPGFETENTGNTTNAEEWLTGTTYNDPDAKRMAGTNTPMGSAASGTYVIGQGHDRDLTGSYGGRPFWSENIPITGGIDYTFEASSYGVGGDYRTAFRRRYKDSGGNEIKEEPSHVTFSPNQWNTWSTTETAPDNAVSVEFYFDTKDQNGATAVYWDDLGIKGGGGGPDNQYVEVTLFGQPEYDLGSDLEFIEVYNQGGSAEDLTGGSWGVEKNGTQYSLNIHSSDPNQSDGLLGADSIGIIVSDDVTLASLNISSGINDQSIRMYSSPFFDAGGFSDTDLEHFVFNRPAGSGGNQGILSGSPDWGDNPNAYQNYVNEVITGQSMAKRNLSDPDDPSGWPRSRVSYGGDPGKVPRPADSYHQNWGWEGTIFNNIPMGDTVYYPSLSSTVQANDVGYFRITRIEDETGKQDLVNPRSVQCTELSGASFDKGCALGQYTTSGRTMRLFDFAEEIMDRDTDVWVSTGDLLAITDLGLERYEARRPSYSAFRPNAATQQKTKVNINTASWEALRGIQISGEPVGTGDTVMLTDEMAKTIIDQRGSDVSSQLPMNTGGHYPELSSEAYPGGVPFSDVNEACGLIGDMDANFQCNVFSEYATVSSEGRFWVEVEGASIKENGNVRGVSRMEALVDRNPLLKNGEPIEILYLRKQ